MHWQTHLLRASVLGTSDLQGRNELTSFRARTKGAGVRVLSQVMEALWGTTVPLLNSPPSQPVGTKSVISITWLTLLAWPWWIPEIPPNSGPACATFRRFQHKQPSSTCTTEFLKISQRSTNTKQAAAGLSMSCTSLLSDRKPGISCTNWSQLALNSHQVGPSLA